MCVCIIHAHTHTHWYVYIPYINVCIYLYIIVIIHGYVFDVESILRREQGRQITFHMQLHHSSPVYRGIRRAWLMSKRLHRPIFIRRRWSRQGPIRIDAARRRVWQLDLLFSALFLFLLFAFKGASFAELMFSGILWHLCVRLFKAVSVLNSVSFY